MVAGLCNNSPTVNERGATMKRYQKAMNTRHRKAMNEANDCAVIAISIACRMTYKAAHELCATTGRKPQQGTYTHATFDKIRENGFNIEQIKGLVQKNGSKYTPKTIGDKLKRGYYLCFCNGHVFAVVNGDVEDWTNERKHHIKSAYKITRKRS